MSDYTDFKTEKGLFREKEFKLSATKRHVEVFGEAMFIKEHALPNLYRQSSVYFGSENWYTTHFESWLEDRVYPARKQ